MEGDCPTLSAKSILEYEQGCGWQTRCSDAHMEADFLAIIYHSWSVSD
jgi:hypothetical protein